MAFDLSFYIFAPTKNSSFEVSDDVIARDLQFGPPPIKNPGYAYEKSRACAKKKQLVFKKDIFTYFRS